MSTTGKLTKSNQFNRSGVVHYRVDQQPNGLSAVTLKIDYELAPVPDHSFVADFAQLSREDSDILLVFGKIDLPGRKVLRNKIELYFPFPPFVYQLWRSSRKLHEMLAVQVAQKGYIAKDYAGVSLETDKVNSMATNNALIAAAGGQNMIDFFLISPKDVWIKPTKGDPLNMNALVRVYLNDFLLLDVLNRIDELAQPLAKELNITITEDDDHVVESL